MSARRWLVAVVALDVAAVGVPRSAAAQTPEMTLARAVAALEATETERGVELLREAIATAPRATPSALRGNAEVRLAVASWSLGFFDSATVHFQAAVSADPFVTLDPEQFNPDLRAVFHAVRRATLVLGVRATGHGPGAEDGTLARLGRRAQARASALPAGAHGTRQPRHAARDHGGRFDRHGGAAAPCGR